MEHGGIAVEYLFLHRQKSCLFTHALCYANVISSFVTVFISKYVETNCSVVPITFPGMAIPNPIPGTGHGGGGGGGQNKLSTK